MTALSRQTLIIGTILCFSLPSAAQVSNTLYFMHGVPQSHRINPAYQPNATFYLGFPGLAPLRTEISSSSLAYGDVIYPHPTQDSLITFLHPLGSKEVFLDLLKPKNFIATDVGTSLASLGFRTEGGFFTLEVTTRVDGSLYYPGDLFRLMIHGAPEGVTHQLDGIGMDIAAFDEVGIGWSASMMDNLQIGVRAKLLFGIASLVTTNSELQVTSSQDTWNIQSDMQFNASVPFADITYDSEGMIDEVTLNQEIEDPFNIPKFAFNTGNMGLGIDVGVNYQPIEQLQLSLSALDIGFINWGDEIHEVSYVTDFDFSGLELNPIDLIGDDSSFSLDSSFSVLGDSLAGYLEFSQGGTFAKRLNTKIFAGASYYVTPKINFGLLSRTDFRSEKIDQQVTATANFTTGRFINFTASYTYSNSYLKNIGAGFAFNVGPLNMYLLSDNILNTVFWPQEVRSVNLWFGMNLVFGYNRTKKDGDRPLIY